MLNECINYSSDKSHLVFTANALPLKRLLPTAPQLLLLPLLVSNNFIAMKLSFIVLAPAGGVGGLEFLCGSEVFIFPQVMAFPIFPWADDACHTYQLTLPLKPFSVVNLIKHFTFVF